MGFPQEDPKCPDCPAKMVGTGTRRGELRPVLEMVEDNYSGCGVDMMECPKCHHVFQVTLKVDTITRCEDWEANQPES